MGLGGSDDVFSRIFGGGGGFQHGRGGRGFGTRRQRGEDFTMELKVSFRDAYSGCEKKVAFSKNGKREELSVKVPAGVENGSRLRLQGKGGEGVGGGPQGDIYLTIVVSSDHQFTREGDDIITELQISFSEATLGCSLEVPTLEGTKRIKVPSGIQPGTKIRLKGLGFTHMGSTGKGDFYVKVGIKVPENLSDDQKALVEKLAAYGL